MGTSKPPPPEFAHPDWAGKVVMTTEDGARWRLSGADWDLVDPPGTHRDAVRHHDVVAPSLDLAARLAGDGVDQEEAIRQLTQL